MSEAELEAIRRSVDHFNETGEPAWHLMDPGVTFKTRGGLGGPMTYTGVDGFKEAMTGFSSVWSEIRWELRDLIGTDTRFVLELRFHLTAASSRVPVEAEEAWAVWMRDGKFTRVEQYGSREEALSAADLLNSA